MTEEKPLWSISIICKNEEESLPELLDSMKPFIDRGGEVIVMDTGSTDDTILVLQKYGFKFSEKSEHQLKYVEVDDKFIFCISGSMMMNLHEKFLAAGDEDFIKKETKIFNFGDARKYAASLCSNDWILSVDCDEVFSGLDIDFLNHIIRTGDVDQLSFTFRYCDSNTRQIRSITTRDKFYNRTVCDWKWVVHEQVMPLEGKHSRMVSVTENTLSLNHYQHPAEHRNNYLIQMCVDVSMCPENDRHTHWLGREMASSGFYNSAIRLLKHHISEFDDAWKAEKCMSCIYIGDSYVGLARKHNGKEKTKLEQKAVGWYSMASYYEKSFREPWMRLAEFYMHKNDHLRAIQYAQAALLIESTPRLYMNDNSCYLDKPYDILYWGYYWLDKREKSYEMWKKARELAPNNLRYANDERLFEGIRNV